MSHLSARILTGAALLFIVFWPSSARADLITVDWDVVPHEVYDTTFDGSPYYECFGYFYGNRSCHWLWEEGLTLEAVRFSFFDDKFFDGFGMGVSEWELPQAAGVMRIRPECKPELGPCFDRFTPVELRISGGSFLGAPRPNLFVKSSNGGLLKFPSLSGTIPITFSGDEWRNLSWIEYGFYLPAACDSADPPENEQVCRRATEKELTLRDLTFEPVPEPTLVWLLAAGAAGLGARRRLLRKR